MTPVAGPRRGAPAEPGRPGGAARPSARELSFAGLFGAAALLLPTVFHLLQLGHAFMPMYIPLIALAFLVSGRIAAITGFLVPLISAALTGMPPIYPPISLIMAIEIAAMAAAIGWLRGARSAWPAIATLLPVLLAGRLLNFGLSYLTALLMSLPAAFVAGLSFIAGWPGVLLMLLVIPPLVRLIGPDRARAL
jgi:hypothetical protein